MSKSQKSDNRGQKPEMLQELQNKINELTEALLRERADAMNVRRRAEEEKHQAANFYKTMILRELLPAIDNLERALMHTPSFEGEGKGDSVEGTVKTDSAARSTLNAQRFKEYVQGVQGVIKQFESAFKQLGVQRIKTVGEHFDPHLHEAVHMDESGDGAEIISVELMPGYKLGDEVIRHAMVKVKMEKK